jgi:hypothetical protein
MISRTARISFILILTTALVIPPPTFSCGWYPDEPVFTSAFEPEDVAEFTQGKIGILLTTYWRIYLVSAYRDLSGVPLTPQEQKAVVNFWKDRQIEQERVFNDRPYDWMDGWLRARSQVLKENFAQGVQYFQPYGTYVWDQENNSGYYNCLPDSFRTAAQTLQERQRQFGEPSPFLADWLAAQDQVFANCGDNFLKKLGHEPFIPAEVAGDAPALLRADRAYQIASAQFYSGEFAESAKRFSSIGDDAQSPWRSIAPYLAGRALLREATLNSQGASFQVQDFEKAEAQFRKVLADPSRKGWHPAAERLINFIELRLHPALREQELASALRAPDPTHFEQNLRDFEYLLGDCNVDGSCSNSASKKPIALDDLTAWIRAFQRNDPEAEVQAVSRWRETRSGPWFAAALTNAHSNTPAVDELLSQADRIARNSPAFALANFHRARILAEAGKAQEAKTLLDSFLKQSARDLPVSSLNLFLSLRLFLARDLGEFLSYSVRLPAMVYGGGGDWGPSSTRWQESDYIRDPELAKGMLGEDAQAFLQTQTPLHDLIRAAQSATLPDPVRRSIAQAAWVRAVLLDNPQATANVTPILKQLSPQLSKDLTQVLATRRGRERGFVAAITILRFPGLSPEVTNLLPERGGLSQMDHYRRNWWADLDDPEVRGGNLGEHDPLRVLYPSGRIDVPGFEPPAGGARAAAEWHQLAQVSTGPNYLSSVVLTWAKSHPEDPRVPEALHLCVRSSRWGKVNDQTASFSKAAFEFLHKHYPNNEWTKRTPYWFN